MATGQLFEQSLVTNMYSQLIDEQFIQFGSYHIHTAYVEFCSSYFDNWPLDLRTHMSVLQSYNTAIDHLAPI